MNDVELGGTAEDLLQHGQMVGQRVSTALVQAERARRARDQSRPGDRITAGEQRHVVPEVDQRLGQERDNPFRAAVELGRHAFVKRRYLSYPHPPPPG